MLKTCAIQADLDLVLNLCLRPLTDAVVLVDQRGRDLFWQLEGEQGHVVSCVQSVVKWCHVHERDIEVHGNLLFLQVLAPLNSMLVLLIDPLAISLHSSCACLVLSPESNEFNLLLAFNLQLHHFDFAREVSLDEDFSIDSFSRIVMGPV